MTTLECKSDVKQFTLFQCPVPRAFESCSIDWQVKHGRREVDANGNGRQGNRGAADGRREADCP